MFWSVTLSLLEGLREVVKLFALTLVFSLPLGLAVTFGSMSKCRPVSWFFNVLVWIVRGTPLMLQLILIFYGPGIWLGHNIWGSQRMLACTVAFVLNYACYFSVIYRGGIEGVPAGQREAGEVLGLTRRQIFYVYKLQHEWTPCDDSASSRKEISPDDVLQHRTLSARLSANHSNLREVNFVASYALCIEGKDTDNGEHFLNIVDD